ncbi:hypothetical protein AWU65_06300 [Paenibacillus glucanolyticus]|uniref:NERD domain-containing protein n=1 Tax=Paenibacillus glucanolyticus TaxID=59843 RepID=A0A163HMW8_9BACL|nr:hypothetical protein [Paenibacillus glucanolyticus]KZS45561.1 hypothetical protein AWU65_06300 [Paenibacillus glucanolyticus]
MNIDYDILKSALSNGDSTTAAEIIYEVYLQHSNNVMKPILLSDCLPEPLQRDFDKKNKTLKTFISACGLVQQRLDENNRDNIDFMIQYMGTIKTIVEIYKHNKSNTTVLEGTELFQIPIPTIIHMMCVFLENQQRLSVIEYEANIKGSKHIDLFSRNVADIDSENGKLSIGSNLEAGIEMFNTLCSYLFYKGKKVLDKDLEVANDVSPYDIPNIEKMSLLALHRGMLNHLWELVKYREWGYSMQCNTEDEEHMYYEPLDEEYAKLELAAMIRYTYKDQLDILKKESLYNSLIHNLIPLESDLAESIDLNDPQSLFRLDTEKLIKLIEFYQKINKSSIKSLEFIDSDFWSQNTIGINRNICFDNYFLFISYLQALGSVYSEKSHEKFDDYNRSGYKHLAPRIEKELIVSNFTEIFGVEHEVASELLNMLTFQPKVHKDDFSDLFSQPLVYMGKKEIILVPVLIKQLNLPRMIEQQFGIWNIDDAYKGKAFERYINMALSSNSSLNVNVGGLKIDDAFDGKSAEFDFIATFGDHILLIEMKCLRRPYTPKEIFQIEHEVNYGVEQVNRRALVLQKDWNKIRQVATIDLPIHPPDSMKIIKVVCLNIFNFTAKVKDDVIITDASSLTKYFVSPLVEQFEVSETRKKIGEYSLWEKEYPTPLEFKEFLRKPNTIADIYDSVEPDPRSLMLIDSTNHPIGFLDFSLTSNPTDLTNKRFKSLKQKLASKENYVRIRVNKDRKKKIKQQKQSRKINRKK